MKQMTFVELLEAVRKLPDRPVTREQRISWVYGNCALSNPDITREMCEKIVDEKYPEDAPKK